LGGPNKACELPGVGRFIHWYLEIPQTVRSPSFASLALVT